MAILAQVAEMDDGGFWYAAPAVVEAEGGFSAPIAGSWGAQYGEVGGTMYAVVRIPLSTTVPPSDVLVADVINAAVAAGRLPSAEKFYARVGGK